jgi:hypothetical protein
VQTLKELMTNKFRDEAFRCLYGEECHVCENTMRIFATLDRDGTSIEVLARVTGSDPRAVRALADADHCDPHLVIRLCQHLNISVPWDCPRLPSTGRTGSDAWKHPLRS